MRPQVDIEFDGSGRVEAEAAAERYQVRQQG